MQVEISASAAAARTTAAITAANSAFATNLHVLVDDGILSTSSFASPDMNRKGGLAVASSVAAAANSAIAFIPTTVAASTSAAVACTTTTIIAAASAFVHVLIDGVLQERSNRDLLGYSHREWHRRLPPSPPSRLPPPSSLSLHGVSASSPQLHAREEAKPSSLLRLPSATIHTRAASSSLRRAPPPRGLYIRTTISCKGGVRALLPSVPFLRRNHVCLHAYAGRCTPPRCRGQARSHTYCREGPTSVFLYHLHACHREGLHWSPPLPCVHTRHVRASSPPHYCGHSRPHACCNEDLWPPPPLSRNRDLLHQLQPLRLPR